MKERFRAYLHTIAVVLAALANVASFLDNHVDELLPVPK